MRLLARVIQRLEQQGIPCALIGGVALAFHGIDRATEDIDLLVTDASILSSPLWDELRAEGFEVEVDRGDFDDPLLGVVRIHAEDVIDLVIPKGRWHDEVLARRLEREILGERIPIVDAADLVLLKVDAGGLIDLIDVEMLLRHDPPLRRAVEERLAGLPPSVQKAWSALAPRLDATPEAPA